MVLLLCVSLSCITLFPLISRQFLHVQASYKHLSLPRYIFPSSSEGFGIINFIITDHQWVCRFPMAILIEIIHVKTMTAYAWRHYSFLWRAWNFPYYFAFCSTNMLQNVTIIWKTPSSAFAASYVDLLFSYVHQNSRLWDIRYANGYGGRGNY